MSEERKIQIETAVDTTGAHAGFEQIKRDAGSMAAAVAAKGVEASRGMDGIGAGASRSAAQVEAAQRNLIGSIQRTTAALEAGSKSGSAYFEVLARQRGVDPKVLEPYLAQLRTMEATQGRATAALAGSAPALDRVGISAKQTAAALRGVPAQFTDIITSIQGGQAPLTVLLQQGGQLKDMFGGAGAAARALGGYVVGLVNPFTIAAAAAAALGVAYYQGSNEAKAYNLALITSGNVAGATAGKLSDMARTISATIGTQGAAAEALTELVQTGRVSGGELVKFGTTAVAVQRALGQSVKDTASEFADLGRTPVTALEKLNEKYHFLTAAVYQQVRALQLQGREDEAAVLAQRTYSDAMDDRAKQVVASLGTIETAWKGVKDWAKKGWDSILDVGREATDADKLKVLSTRIANRQSDIEDAVARNGGKDSQSTLQARAELAPLLVAQELAQATTREANRANEAKARGIKLEEAKIAWMKEGEKYLARDKQLKIEIRAIEEKGAQAGVDRKEINKRIAEATKKYADINNASIDASIEKMKRLAVAEEVRGKRAQEQIAFLRQIGNLTEQDAIKSSTEVEVAALDRRKALLVDELALIKQKSNSDTAQAAKSAEIDAAEESRRNRALQGERELILLAERRAQASRDLFNKGIVSAQNETQALLEALEGQREYNEGIGLNKRQAADLAATRLESTASLKLESAAAIESIEPNSALAASYRDQAAALTERAKLMREGAGKEFQFDEWTKSVDTYGDVFRKGFSDMLNNGRAGWSSFTKSLVTTFKTSVADQLYKMFAQPFVMKLVASLIGVTGGASIANASSLANGDLPSAGGGIGSALGVVGIAQNLYSALSGGFAGLGTTVTNAINGGLNALNGTSAIYGPTLAGGNIAGASPFAAAAGTAASYLGGAAVGVFGGRALSNGYSAFGSGSGNSAVNIGTIAGAIFGGPIGAAIGGLIGGAANRLFGLGPKELTSSKLEGSFGGNGFSGDTISTFLQQGGLFRSDKTSTTTVAVDALTQKAFTAAYDALKVASADFATTLGINADSIKDRAQKLSIALTGDKAADEKAIADFFVGVGDTIATELLPTISEFSKASTVFGQAGESASATLQRIATDYSFIDVALDSIGVTFGSVGIASVAARERLLELSGGVEAFGRGTAFFAQNYLTEAERLIPVAAKVQDVFLELGLAVPKTRDEFKTLKLGLDLTSESGAKAYAKLSTVQEAFAQLNPVIDKVALAAESLSELNGLQAELDQLILSPSQLLAKQRAAISENNRGLFDQIQAYTAIKKAQDAARETMNSLGNAIAGAMERAQDAAKALRGYNDALLVGSSSPLSKNVKYDLAKQQFLAAKPEDLQTASNVFLEASKAKGGTASYARDFASVSAAFTSAAAGKDKLVTGLINLYRSISQGPGVVSAHADGGVASGWSLVGERGPELANFVNPARIYTAQQTQEALGGGMSSRAETLLATLVTEMQRGNKDMKETAQILDGIIRGKFSLRTVAA